MNVPHMVRVGDQLVAAEDTYVRYVDAETGEIMAEVPISRGTHAAADFVAMAKEGQRLEFDDDVFVMEPSPRMAVMRFPHEHMFGSAAKQQYQMSESTRAQKIRERAKAEANAATRHAAAVLRRMERAAETWRNAEAREAPVTEEADEGAEGASDA